MPEADAYTVVIERIKREGIRWLELQTTDLVGYLRSVYVSARGVTVDQLKRGFGKLDGSSVKGFKPIHDSDLVLLPDPETYAKIPWSPEVARLICDIYDRGESFIRDPRAVARRVEEYLAGEGYLALVGPEPEFFFFDDVELSVGHGEQVYRVYSAEAPWSGVLDSYSRIKESYQKQGSLDHVLDIRLELARVLEENFGLRVVFHHHEAATAGQLEAGLEALPPLRVADAIQTLKYAARAVARMNDMIAVFLPKPLYGDNGSGLHLHLSLYTRDGTNLFYDPNDEYAELSQLGRYFIGGLMEHGRALSALVSPTVNSYRRLVPGFEAPVYLTWSRGNRSTAIRVPFYEKGDVHKRVEYRPPDMTCNPYLAVAAVVLAGLDGIKRRIDPGDPVDEDVYRMPEWKLRQLGIKRLPRSLEEALDELESDCEFLKPAFPSELLEAYIEAKRLEARTLQQYPSPAEVHYYIDL